MADQFDCELVTVYWATILDNVIAGYDIETHSFHKEKLPFLKFKEHCYFVTEEDLPLGIKKATRIAHSVAKQIGMMPAICVLKAQFPRKELFENDRGEFGMYRIGSTFSVSALFIVSDDYLELFSERELLILQQQARGRI